jgi:hypothetical protein
VAAIATFIGAAPAAATGLAAAAISPATDALIPLVDCVQDAPLGAVSSRTVVLGYSSTAASTIQAPAGGGANDLTGGAADRGQPSTFEPGEHHGVWLLTLDAATEPNLGWRLGTATAAFDSAPACTAATTVAISVPPSAGAGGTIAVTATVTRMLLAAPGDGTVDFVLDGGQPVPSAVSATGVARADLPVATQGAHTVRAIYRPAAASGLLSSTASAAFVATAPSAPLTIEADSVVAGSTSVRLTISRASGTGTASVDYVTADGTARATADYVATSGTATLADGQLSTSVTVPVAQRAAGSPAATFFVLLQRASTTVAVASATVSLPAVASPATAAALPAGDPGGAGPASALPQSDPTAAGASAVGSVGQDLAVLLGGVLITAGGIFGVVGLVRAAGMRDARA